MHLQHGLYEDMVVEVFCLRLGWGLTPMPLDVTVLLDHVGYEQSSHPFACSCNCRCSKWCFANGAFLLLCVQSLALVLCMLSAVSSWVCLL